MKALKIAIVILALIISASCVCAADSIDDDTLENTCCDVYVAENSTMSFTDLQADIDGSGNVFNMKNDYRFNNDTDSVNGTVISRSDFVINGNNHVLDANKQSRIFNVTGKNITINDLIFINGNSERGGAIHCSGQLTLNNVTFIANNATHGGAIFDAGSVICNNSRFIDNQAKTYGASIYALNGNLNVYNAYMTSNVENKFAQVVLKSARGCIEDSVFENISSSYCPAVFLLDGCDVSIRNSRFVNLRANLSAGAVAIKGPKSNASISNCEFINTSSSKNGGAIFVDVDSGDYKILHGVGGNVSVEDCLFTATSSEYGGAFLQLGGRLAMSNCVFTDDCATFEGGAVYVSFVDGEIRNCTFDSNSIEVFETYPTYGGALYCDFCALNLTESRFFNNGGENAVYLLDSFYNITNSVFTNNTYAILTFFDKSANLNNNTYNNDSIITNATFFYTSVVGSGTELVLLNNTIDVTDLPSRFDLRDWGWVSPVRNQGIMGACWTFASTCALETALLRACGIATDFSENNMQNSMLKYADYGLFLLYEGGASGLGASYLVSWLGDFSQEYDEYDELGKISPTITTPEDVHVQDAIFIKDYVPGSLEVKSAIMNYGSLYISYYAQSRFDEENPYYNPENYSHYCNVSRSTNHGVSVVGWDDSFAKENFAITPPGDGAWIIKNSWGEDWGDDGYFYLSYWDKSISRGMYAKSIVGIIFENPVVYNKNYQYVTAFIGNFLNDGDEVICANSYDAYEDDLIAAVGTYFEKANSNYTVYIYVNDELKLVQEGISPYAGFHTIRLDEYVSIKAGDHLRVAMASPSMPYIEADSTRIHYKNNCSFIFRNGVWSDLYDEDKILCLKAYTVGDDSKIIANENISVDYDGGKCFSVRVTTGDGDVAVKGAVVNFTINGVTKSVKTGADGVAEIKITQAPKTYTVKTQYAGKTYTNKVTVKHVVKANAVSVKRTASKFTLKATLKINSKPVKGKWVKFKFNGKTYKAKTNSKGVAKVIVKKNVIKKLKKGKTYTVKVTYAKDTIKTTVKVK